jgi:hypothetical protein
VSGDTDDPVIKAIMVFVEGMCAVTMAETTGFYNARTAEEQRAEVRRVFIVEMNRATQDEGP